MDVNLKKFKLERLDPISPTFCAAKWLFLDIYLHTGVTSSCHYPQPHKINFDQIENNVLKIHNTTDKMQQRELMLNGQQPSVCSNCWNIENISNDVASARVVYSKVLEDEDFSVLKADSIIPPRYVNVVFDTYCNFKCTYCDGSQSSSWNTDLKTFGPIQTQSDTKKTYIRTGDEDVLSEEQYNNLLLKFTNMIVENLSSIKQITVLGGEPTMSPGFWKFLDLVTTLDGSQLSMGIITNGSKINELIKYAGYKKYFKRLFLGVSIDGTGKTAEFVRCGLNWNDFNQNIEKLLDTTDIDIYFTGTLNILALDGLVNCLDWFLEKSKIYKDRVSLSLTVCRWPVFQAIGTLPIELKINYIKDLRLWLQDNQKYCSIELIEQINQVITLLDTPDNSDVKVLNDDLRLFVNEFSRRNNLDITTAFSSSLSSWILKKE